MDPEALSGEDSAEDETFAKRLIAQRSEKPLKLRPEAFEYSRAVGRYSQAVAEYMPVDPTAVLISSLTFAGAIAGRAVWRQWGNRNTHPLIWSIVVGDTARGGKGLAQDSAEQVFKLLPGWQDIGYLQSVNSGEGLVKGLLRQDDNTIVGDRRAVVVMPEYQQAMRVAARAGSTSDIILRVAYDGGRLDRNTVDAGEDDAIEHPSIAMLAFVQGYVLRHEANGIDVASGTLNRPLYVPSHTEFIPVRPVPPTLAEGVAEAITPGLQLARAINGPVTVAPEAEQMLARADEWQWRLPDGAVGTMLGRVAQNIARVALANAICRTPDSAETIILAPEDVVVGAAFADVSEQLAMRLWGRRATNAEVQSLIDFATTFPNGPSKRDLHNQWASTRLRGHLDALLEEAHRAGLIDIVRSGRGHRYPVPAGQGKPTVWNAVVGLAGVI